MSGGDFKGFARSPPKFAELESPDKCRLDHFVVNFCQGADSKDSNCALTKKIKCWGAKF